MPGPTSTAITPFTWLFLAILLRAVNQILMKFAAMEWAAMEWAAREWTALERLGEVQIWTTAGLGIGIVLVLLTRAYAWQKALADLPLAVAYPFFALTLITLMGSGYLIFGEPITRQNLAGTGLICIGIYVIAGSYKSGNSH